MTDKGKDIVSSARDLFQDPHAADNNEVRSARAIALEHPQRAISTMDAVVEALRRNFTSPLWDKLAQACIGCGACTYLCPSCHCFDINDEVTGKSPLTGARVRTWGNCQFPMKFVINNLREMGFADEQIYTTIENKMKCGIGKCGRCNVGKDYVCVKGPVYSWAQLKTLPQEY